MKSSSAIAAVAVLAVATAGPAAAAPGYDPLTKGEARIILSDTSLAPTGFGAAKANPFFTFKSGVPQVCWTANGNMKTLPKASVQYMKMYVLNRYNSTAGTFIYSYATPAKAKEAGRILAKMNCPNAAKMADDVGVPLVAIDQGGDQTDALYGNLGYSTGYTYKEYDGKMYTSLNAYRQVGNIVVNTSILVPKAKATAGGNWARTTVDAAATAYHAKLFDADPTSDADPAGWAPTMVDSNATTVPLVVGQQAVFANYEYANKGHVYVATSSDPSVVQVEPKATSAVPAIRGASPGTATVTVTDGATVVQSVTVTVTPYKP